MYAIIETGGKQIKVEDGMEIFVRSEEHTSELQSR